MADKQYITSDQLLTDSYRLARNVLESGFRPDFIVALWRGGTPIGIAGQEFMACVGVTTDHIAIRTSSYTGVNERRAVEVHSTGYLVKTANHTDRILLVDDVFDSGHSIVAVLQSLGQKMRRNTPLDIRVATIYYKPENNDSGRVPDFYLYTTDKWLVFPHELVDLSEDEIRGFKGDEIADLVEEARRIV